ncbi:MAG: alpha/beta hydrolase [Planctomycetaceae bacterium]|nr:alpha/beta hydrolase [Planctomycetaceae bacterium]
MIRLGQILFLGFVLGVMLMPGGVGWCQEASKLPSPIVMDLWPESLNGRLPGDPADYKLPEEADTSTEQSDRVAGRTVIRLGNVSLPQVAVYQPPQPNSSRAAVVICPGGGYHILAYDLEGTEVAEWLVKQGVTAIVLKYRVPARPGPDRWKAAVIDAQRALSLTRQKAKEWNIDPNRIGILGFSAGGHAAAVASSEIGRQYDVVDEADKMDCRPTFSLLIYPAYLAEGDELSPLVGNAGQYPPTFLVHAQDDPVTPLNSLTFATHLQKLGVPLELHLFREGGHGYGLRRTDFPVTGWPEPATQWLSRLWENPPVAAPAKAPSAERPREK